MTIAIVDSPDLAAYGLLLGMFCNSRRDPFCDTAQTVTNCCILLLLLMGKSVRTLL